MRIQYRIFNGRVLSDGAPTETASRVNVFGADSRNSTLPVLAPVSPVTLTRSPNQHKARSVVAVLAARSGRRHGLLRHRWPTAFVRLRPAQQRYASARSGSSARAVRLSSCAKSGDVQITATSDQPSIGAIVFQLGWSPEPSCRVFLRSRSHRFERHWRSVHAHMLARLAALGRWARPSAQSEDTESLPGRSIEGMPGGDLRTCYAARSHSRCENGLSVMERRHEEIAR